MRVAFTIIYEGLHHLKHLEFAEKMCSMFDHWIVVEGYSLPYGSTKWCNKLNVPESSTDGTVEYLKELALKNSNLHFHSHGRHFFGKDEQVNVAVNILKQLTDRCYLWEVDADEHWKMEDIIKAEQEADKSTEIGFSFCFNQFVGPGLVARGDWGSGALNRLWKWSGQLFRSHEPALLMGQRRTKIIESVKYDHYSYYFAKDVLFKSKSYPGHELVHERWEHMKNQTSFPVHISVLFGLHSRIGKSKSYIEKIN